MLASWEQSPKLNINRKVGKVESDRAFPRKKLFKSICLTGRHGQNHLPNGVSALFAAKMPSELRAIIIKKLHCNEQIASPSLASLRSESCISNESTIQQKQLSEVRCLLQRTKHGASSPHQ